MRCTFPLHPRLRTTCSLPPPQTSERGKRKGQKKPARDVGRILLFARRADPSSLILLFSSLTVCPYSTSRNLSLRLMYLFVPSRHSASHTSLENERRSSCSSPTRRRSASRPSRSTQAHEGRGCAAHIVVQASLTPFASNLRVWRRKFYSKQFQERSCSSTSRTHVVPGAHSSDG